MRSFCTNVIVKKLYIISLLKKKIIFYKGNIQIRHIWGRQIDFSWEERIFPLNKVNLYTKNQSLGKNMIYIYWRKTHFYHHLSFSNNFINIIFLSFFLKCHIPEGLVGLKLENVHACRYVDLQPHSISSF